MELTNLAQKCPGIVNLTQSQNMVVCGGGGTLLCNPLGVGKKYLILSPFPNECGTTLPSTKYLTKPKDSNGTFTHSNPIHFQKVHGFSH